MEVVLFISFGIFEEFWGWDLVYFFTVFRVRVLGVGLVEDVE